MHTFVPWRFAAVTALTVVLGYVACTVLWLLFSGPFIAFMNALFHGLDFRALYIGGAFDAGSWLGAVVVLGIWAFLMGAVFAALINWMRVERPLPASRPAVVS